MRRTEVAHPLFVRLGFLGTVDEIPAVLRSLGFAVRELSAAQVTQAETRSLDLLIVAGWGEVLPEAVFAAPRHGTWNVHPSQLPARRGADPLRWAFLEGDERFGVSIHQMVRLVDAGPVLWSTSVDRTQLDTHTRMIRTLMALAACALPSLLQKPAEAPKSVAAPQSPPRPRVPLALQRLDPALDATTLQRRIAAFDDRAPSLLLRGRAIALSQSVAIDASDLAAPASPGRIFGVEGARIALHTSQGALLAIARDANHGARIGDVLTAKEGA